MARVGAKERENTCMECSQTTTFAYASECAGKPSAKQQQQRKTENRNPSETTTINKYMAKMATEKHWMQPHELIGMATLLHK